jgi:ketosteroid isomerase-like protein
MPSEGKAMTKKSSLEIEAIKGIIHAINECWRLKDYEGIVEFLTEDVVIAPPGSDERIYGRAAYVQSYRDYDQSAETQEFLPGDPKVDLAGNTAVAVCPFEVVYKLQGTKHHEKGKNILVFSLSHGRWKVVWRTMQVEAATESTG